MCPPNDAPDLFPGLTADDRAKLAQLAERMETVPEILNRLNGYLLDLSKQQLGTPGIAVRGSGLDRTVPAPLTPVPLVTDLYAVLRTYATRRVQQVLQVRIPAGETSATFTIRPEGIAVGDDITQSQFSGMALDAAGRLAGETITLYGGITPATMYSMQALFGATQGVTATVSAVNAILPVWRITSAVPVAGDRVFTFIL